MSAVRNFYTASSRLQLMDVCASIASGNKSVYFNEMQKLQRFFPTLHRRALLAPFVLSSNQTLSSYAIEYFFNTHQTKPTHHPPNCCCGDLQFTDPELMFIFKTFNQVTQLKAERRCIKADFLLTPTTHKKFLFQCPDSCRTLAEESYGDWESRDELATPEANFELMNCVQTASISHTSAPNVKHLIYAGLIKGFKLHYQGGPRTSLLAIKAFNDEYILRSEIAKQTGYSHAKLREILEKNHLYHCPWLSSCEKYPHLQAQATPQRISNRIEHQKRIPNKSNTR